MTNKIQGSNKIAVLMPVAGSGGVQKVITNLVNGLASIGWLVDVVCADARGGLNGLDSSANIIDLGVSSTHGDLKLIKGMGKVRAAMRERDYDALVTAPGFAGQIGIIACRGLSTKVVVMVDNKLSLLRELGGLHRLQLKSAQILYPKASVVVAAHDSALADLDRVLPANRKAELVRIYHPLIPGNVTELAKEEPLVPLPGDCPVIVGAGRLVEEKDFATLLRAFAIVRSRRSAELILLGDGPLRGDLERLAGELGIAGNVRFAGMVDNVYAYFSRSSVFVLSSKREAFGNVLIEALACGAPCVATRCASGGPQEILADGEYGRLVEIGDVEGIAEAIDRTLDDSANGYCLASNLVDRSFEFTVARSTSQYSSLLGGLLK